MRKCAVAEQGVERRSVRAMRRQQDRCRAERNALSGRRSKWPLISMPTSGAPANPQAGAQREWEAGIADGRDVLAVEKILGLRVDVDPGKPLVAAAEVEFRVAVVEIAVGQQ